MAPTSNELVWNVTIPDTSPLIQYAPCSNCNLSRGWMSSYTDGTFLQQSTGWLWGNGTSQHVTTQDGAALSFAFEGTSMWLFGDASNMSYTIQVDNSDVDFSSGDGLLAYVTGIEADKTHSLTFRTSHNGDGSRLAFNGAEFTVPSGYTGATLHTNTVYSLDIDIAYQGFQPVSLPDVDGGRTVYESRLKGDTASYSFTGQGVWILGMLNDDHGFYEINLDNSTRRLNGQSKFAVADGLLFYQGNLDPSTTHDLTITNLDGSPLDLGFIQVASAVNGTPINSTPKAKALLPALLALTTLVTIISLGLVVLLYCRRLRKPQRGKSVDLTSDALSGVVATPYPARPRPPRPTVTIPIHSEKSSFAGNRDVISGQSIRSHQFPHGTTPTFSTNSLFSHSGVSPFRVQAVPLPLPERSRSMQRQPNESNVTSSHHTATSSWESSLHSMHDDEPPGYYS